MNLDRVLFLDVEDVLAVHAETIARHGGSEGVRDRNLLESAVGMPMSTFGGQWLHDSIEAMAAAYLFHLCQNHPFVDGNKRTSAASAMIFLRMNGYRPTLTQDELVALTLRVARGELDKGDIAGILHTRVDR